MDESSAGKRDDYIKGLVEESKDLLRQGEQEFADSIRADLDSFKKKALARG